MKNKFFYLSALVCAFFLIALSCKQSASEEIASSKRLELTKGKSIEVLKANYMSLSTQTKKELWIEKVQQLLTQTLPSPQFTLIKELETELLKNDCDFTSFANNVKIQDIGIRLASITPREDFLKMFVSLDNYYYKNAFIGKEICSDCIKDMESDSRNIGKTLQTRLADCNCNWTCGSATTTTSNCSPTSLGCGFLWLGSCRQRDCISC